MKNKDDMIKWLDNLKTDIGQGQHQGLWHYAEILDVVVKYLEVSEPVHGEWVYGNGNGECSVCGKEKSMGWDNYCGYCGAKMGGDTE